jgi:hypothetical protein
MKLKGDTMRSLYLLLSILSLALFLIGCAPSAKVKTLEDYRMPTLVPAASELTATADAEIAALTPPEDCPVTIAESTAFKAPEPYSPDAPWQGLFWFGSEGLWTALQTNGVWSGLPDNPEGYTQKIAWWSKGYVWNEETQPSLMVTGKRLDAEAPPLKASTANGAYADDMGSAMMMSVDFPALGCWEITGQYKESELTFVVWIAP